MNILKNNINQNLANKNKPKTLLIISNDLPLRSLYQILLKNPTLVNEIDNKGETLLSYSIKRKKIDICQLILTSKILDLSYQDKNGNSYLHLATINQLEGVVKTLIEKGIYINMQNNDGNTPLHLAYLNDNIPIINILRNNKIDTKIKNNERKIAEELKKMKDYLKIENKNQKGKDNKISKNIKEAKLNNQKIDKQLKNQTINLNTNNNNNSNIKNKVYRGNYSCSNSIKKIINKNIDNKNTTMNSNLNKNIFNNNYVNSSKKKENKDKNHTNRTSPFLEEKIMKKQQSKKSIKNTNKNKIFTKEENNINIKNKINLLDRGNNTSGETKSKSGTYQEKINYIKEQEKIKNINININSNKEKGKDIFNIAESIDYKQKLVHTSELNTQIVKSPNYEIKKKIFKEDKINNINDEDIVNFNEKKIESKKQIINEVIIDYKNDDFEEKENHNFNDNEYDEEDYYSNFKFVDDNNYNNNFNNDSLNKYDEEKILEQNKSSLNFFENSLFNNHFQQKKSKNGFQGRNYAEFQKNKEVDKTYKTNKEVKISIKSNKEYSYNVKPFDSTKDKKNNKNRKENINKNNIFKSYAIDLQSQKRKTFSNKYFKENKNDSSTENKLNPYITNNNYYTNILSNNMMNSDNLIHKINHNPLKEFLSQINMIKYMKNFIESGFDDINLIIEQAQKGIYIKDNELKEAGIILPGDRAKILIRIQEKAKNFPFAVPKNVYYTCNDLNMIENDENIYNLNNWLKNLKIENYLTNFIDNGYHSIELLLLQMESKNPLNVEILKNELGIDKIGHRSRIINKLKDEGRSYNNKLKTSILLLGDGEKNKNCDCLIY